MNNVQLNSDPPFHRVDREAEGISHYDVDVSCVWKVVFGSFTESSVTHRICCIGNEKAHEMAHKGNPTNLPFGGQVLLKF